jgi:hypothetical protein
VVPSGTSTAVNPSGIGPQTGTIGQQNTTAIGQPTTGIGRPGTLTPAQNPLANGFIINRDGSVTPVPAQGGAGAAGQGGVSSGAFSSTNQFNQSTNLNPQR